MGIIVPEQIGIVGFHGHDISQVMVPKLATVVTPREQIGEIAAQELLKRLKGQEITQTIIDLDFKIELGESLCTYALANLKQKAPVLLNTGAFYYPLFKQAV